ncbi:MAG: PASTA domain-containing protein [Bacteroidetes bacterium]|nr:PASTA domain-containing protein [Bacteroidota bacterium]
MNKNHSFLLRLLWSNLARKFYLAAVILIALFSVMNWIVMPWYVRDGGTVRVPDVVGMHASEAKVALDTSGVQFEMGSTESSREPINTVLSQNPEGHSIVKRGRRVYVVLSAGVEKASVPDLRGHSEREAQFMLERAGLVVGTITYDSSSNFPANVVMSQTVPPNASIPNGSAVSLVVSSGAVLAGEVSVPDLVGHPLPEAQRLLFTSGLALGKVVFQPNSRLVPNTVLEQYPRSHAIVAKGTSINLYVSALPNQTGPPQE